jgi:hypothetical protein
VTPAVVLGALCLAAYNDLGARLAPGSHVATLAETVAPQAASLVMVAFALVEPAKGAAHDLVEPRRRLRRAFIVPIAAYISLIELVELALGEAAYHHIDDRVAYFARPRESLAAHGRAAHIDVRDDVRGLVRIFLRRGHWSNVPLMRAEMREAGFAVDRSFDFLRAQSFQIFVQLAPPEPARDPRVPHRLSLQASVRPTA